MNHTYPLVDARGTRSNTALGDTRHTVLVIGASLSNTVPMDGCGVGGQAVDNGDFNHVTPVSHNGLTWRLAVDSERMLESAVIVELFFGDCQSIFLGLASVEGLVGIVIDRFANAPVTSVIGTIAARLGETGSRGSRSILARRRGGGGNSRRRGAEAGRRRY